MACNTGSSEATDKINTFEIDLGKANSIVNGDDVTDVAVDSGACPTFRKTMKGITDAATGSLTLSEAAAALATSEADRARTAADEAEAITGIVPATETAIGIIQVATDAETKASTIDNKAVSPKNLGLYVAERTTTIPTLTLPTSANEGESVTGSYTVPEGANPVWSIPVAITDFVDNNTGGFTFTSPHVTVDTNYTLSVSATKQGQLGSEYVSSVINILDVEIQDGPTVTYANTVAAWPNATIVSESISVPAYSIGALNANQIVSAIPEIVVINGELPVLGGTTPVLLNTSSKVVEGGKYIANNGVGYFGTVTSSSSDDESSATPDTANGLGSGPASLSWDNTLTGSSDSVSHLSYQGIDYGTLQAWLCELVGTTITPKVKTGLFNPTGRGTIDYIELSSPYTLDSGTTYVVAIEAVGASNIDCVAGTGYAVPASLAADALQACVSDSRFVSAGYRLAGEYTAVIDLPAAPLVAFKNPTQGEIINVAAGTTSTSLKSSNVITEGQKFESDKGDFVAGAVVYLDPIYTATITGLTETPTYASRKTDDILKVGVGITGEHIGPEEILTLGTGSTISSIVTISSESQKDKIFVTGGLHNTLSCDGVEKTVTAISETGAGPYEQTSTLDTSLAQTPLVVAIPNGFTQSPANIALIVLGSTLKATGSEIILQDEATLKQIALSVVSPDTLKFKDAKIYIKERL